MITCNCQVITCISRPLPNQTNRKVNRSFLKCPLLLLNWSDSFCWKYRFCNMLVWTSVSCTAMHGQFKKFYFCKYWRDCVMIEVWIKGCWLSKNNQLSLNTKCLGPLCPWQGFGLFSLGIAFYSLANILTSQSRVKRHREPQPIIDSVWFFGWPPNVSEVTN